jgi:hypothetical protein
MLPERRHMPKPKTPANVIPMPPPAFSADRIPELRARLREFKAFLDHVIKLLDAMRRPQLVSKRRRRK